jgi:hypothetical protein
MISAEALDQFKQIIWQDYGFKLDDAEATKLANDYLVALEAVISPPREDLTTPTEKRQNED